MHNHSMNNICKVCSSIYWLDTCLACVCSLFNRSAVLAFSLLFADLRLQENDNSPIKCTPTC